LLGAQKIEKMVKKEVNGEKVFVGTFESSKHKIRKEPNELVIEKMIKKMLKRCKTIKLKS